MGGCLCVSDPRLIQFASGSCYTVHINALSIELKCTSKETTCKLNKYDSVKKMYRLYSRLLLRSEEFNATSTFTLGCRYNISLFDSNHFKYP